MPRILPSRLVIDLLDANDGQFGQPAVMAVEETRRRRDGHNLVVGEKEGPRLRAVEQGGRQLKQRPGQIICARV